MILLSALPGHALAQSSTTPSSGTGTIIGAIIAAIALVAGILLRDLFVARTNEDRSRRLVRADEDRARQSDQADVFRNYLGPLADSCEKLMWRFNEIFIAKRHHFFKLKTLPIEFNHYKRQSTLYRIASLIGWIRAINRELSSIPFTESSFSNSIYRSLDGVRHALAEGVRVEQLRLQRLLEVWNIPFAEGDTAKLAADLEVHLYAAAGASFERHSDGLPTLDKAEQLAICQSMAQFLSARLARRIPDEVVSESVSRAIAAVSFREALIYSDWQDAIGDAMLKRDEDSPRRFALIGFAEFDTLLQSDRVWFSVFRSSIDDIDFETIDPSDYRGSQLLALAKAVSKVVEAIAASPHKDLLDPGAATIGNQILALP